MAIMANRDPCPVSFDLAPDSDVNCGVPLSSKTFLSSCWEEDIRPFLVLYSEGIGPFSIGVSNRIPRPIRPRRT